MIVASLPTSYQQHSQKRHELVASCEFYRLKQACRFHQVATSLLKSGLLQLFIYRLVTTCLNNLQQACWWQVILMNLQQVCWQLAKDLSSTSCRKPCERILISACCNKLLQNVSRLVVTCVFMAVKCSLCLSQVVNKFGTISSLYVCMGNIISVKFCGNIT